MPAFSVKKPLTIFVATLAVIVLGVVAYLRMTPDLMPNMDFPYVIVVTTDPGASPESIEEEITKPMEKAMATLNEIKSISSTSQDSVSMVMMEFEEGVNMDTIGVDIQQNISVLQEQWDDMVSAPYVLKINPSMLPVMVAAVSSDEMDIETLSTFVEDTLEDKMTGVTGVASVDVSGIVKREAHVILSQEKMDEVNKNLSENVGKQLDKAEKKLKDGKKELTDAQEELDDGWDTYYSERYKAEKQLASATDQMTAARQGLDGLSALLKGGKELLNNSDTVLRGYTDLYGMVSGNPAMAMIAGQLPDPAGKTVSELAGALAQKEAQTALMTIESALSANPATAEMAAGISGIKTFATSWVQVEGGLAKALDLTGATTSMSLNETNLLKLSEFITTSEKQYEKGYAELKSGKEKAQDGFTEAEEKMKDGQKAINDGNEQIDKGLEAIKEARETISDQTKIDEMLSIHAIQQLLTAQDFYMPAGYIDDNEGISYMVSVGNKVETREDLSSLVLIDFGVDGVDTVTLDQVADVFFTDNTAEIYTKLNGQDDVIVTFNKQSNYATAEVSENVLARFRSLEQEYPGLHFVPLMDQGDYINLITDSIISSLLWGALFSVIVLFFFLRDWRPTVITLVSIPVSVIFAVVLMYFSGVTINMISLSGLAVSVGMLVDNSVVVIENIYRLRAKGATIIQAAVSGAGQVLGAITASTLTTVCVFLPIVFVDGITKTLFTDLALTMTYSLMASLIVAITLVPAMAQGILRKEYQPKKGILDLVYPAYRKAIKWSLGHKALVFLLAVVLLVSSAAGTIVRGFVFMPEMDMNMISAGIAMPEDVTREEAVELADEVCRRAMTVENVSAVGAMMSGDSFSVTGGGGGAYDVTVYITMPEGTSGMKAGREIEKLCADMDCEVNCDGINAMTSMMTGGSGISLTVYGEDMENLQEAARVIGKRMEAVEGTTDVSDGLEDAAQAVRITIDRAKAMEHGMTVAQVYMQIAQKLTNTVSGAELTLDQQKMDVVIESIEGRRVMLEDLEKLTLAEETSMAGAMGGASMGGDMAAMMDEDEGEDEEETKEEKDDGKFALGEIASVEKTVSLNNISRADQRRCVTVSAAIDEGYNVTLVTAEVEKALDGLTLPEGTSYSFGGENEAIMEALRQLVLMMLLGIVLVYFIMVAQFQSLKSPFIVMFTIPLAFTGGFLGLLISGFELSVVSMIGFVMLVGIIVNNGIVLVDYINQQRLAGMERHEAIIDAGVTRMRPILMTSLTTILGLIVMALAKNVGTSLMQPVAVVCIGGLLYATLMTLFVVPCMYDLMNKKELRVVNAEELELLED